MVKEVHDSLRKLQSKASILSPFKPNNDFHEIRVDTEKFLNSVLKVYFVIIKNP